MTISDLIAAVEIPHADARVALAFGLVEELRAMARRAQNRSNELHEDASNALASAAAATDADDRLAYCSEAARLFRASRDLDAQLGYCTAARAKEENKRVLTVLGEGR
jgi:hypothetical protein